MFIFQAIDLAPKRECQRSRGIRTIWTTQTHKSGMPEEHGHPDDADDPTHKSGMPKVHGHPDDPDDLNPQTHKSGMPEEKGHSDDPDDPNPQIRNVRGARTSTDIRAIQTS